MKQEQIRLYGMTWKDIEALRMTLYDWSNGEWRPIRLWGKEGDFTIGFGDNEDRFRAIVYKIASGYHIDIVDNLHGDLYELT